MSSSDNISLHVLTPEATVLDRKVSKVSLPGIKGRFMILKDHAPLISSLEEGDVVFEAEGTEERICILSGFVEVTSNMVTVCAEI